MKRLISITTFLLAIQVSVGAPAQAPTSPADDLRPVVVGTGNRLSGRLPVLFVDAAGKDHPAYKAFAALAEVVAGRSKLAIELTTAVTLTADTPPVPLVFFGRAPTEAEAGALLPRLAAGRCTAAVFGIDTRKPLPESLRAAVVGESRRQAGTGGEALLADIPPAGASDPGFVGFTVSRGATARLFLIKAGSPRHLEPFLLFLVRHAILRGGGVLHLPTVFTRITPVPTESKIGLTVETARPGDVLLSLIHMTGTPVLEKGPLRPVDPATVTDPENTIVRLNWRGPDGLHEEARLWFRELRPETLAALRLFGPRRLPAGEPVRLRLVAFGGDGRVLPGLELASGTIRSRTDGNGVAWLELPPFPPTAVGRQRAAVRVAGPGIDRELTAVVHVVPRPLRLILETDRPVYRPGGRVQVRLLLVDAISRHAISGARVSVGFSRADRDVQIARFEVATDAYGVAVVTLPLAAGLTEGDFRITARAAEGERETARGALSFRVASLVLPRFAVRIALEKEIVGKDEPVAGTIRAATHAGAPLAGAEAVVELEGGGARLEQTVTLDAEGRAAFAFPAQSGRADFATLRVVVSHLGARVRRFREVWYTGVSGLRITCRTEPSPLLVGRPGRVILAVAPGGRVVGEAEPPKARLSWQFEDGVRHRPTPDTPRSVVVIPISARKAPGTCRVTAFMETPSGERRRAFTLPIQDGLGLDCPDAVKPGATLSVRVDAARDEGLVLVDLTSGGVVLAGGAGRLDEGRARIEVKVPDGYAGPARVTARLADAPNLWPCQRTLVVTAETLTVKLKTDHAVAAPGETVQLTARVTDPAGRPTRALLDVRGYDRGYREVARVHTERHGQRGALGLDLGRELDRRGTDKGPALLDQREPAVDRARFTIRADRLARSILAETPETGRSLPWGGRIVRTRLQGHLLVQGEPALTTRTGAVGPVGAAGAALVIRDTSSNGLLRTPVILPRMGPAGRAGSTGHARPASAAGLREDSWLARCQAPDGSFPVLAPEVLASLEPGERPGDPWLEPGTTGLALLAFLGAGYTHQAGKYADVVDAGLDYLTSRQGEDGFIGDPDAPWAVLNHCMCALTLTEAYGMSNSRELRGVVERALAALVARQREDGAFGESGFKRPSLTATAWAILAFKAQKSAGLEGHARAFQGIQTWLDTTADSKTGAAPMSPDEIAAYPFPGLEHPRVAAGMTLIMRVLLGHDPGKDAAIQKLAKVLLANLPRRGDPDMHGTRWGTLAMFQVGGPAWKRWNSTMKAVVVDTQVKSGPGRGSWRGAGGLGRLANTCFATLQLEVYYRYGKVFGVKDPDAVPRPAGAGPPLRRRFEDLLIADMARLTNPTGYAEIPLKLPDNLTPWDLRVGAWDGRGRWGLAQTTVTASLPLHLEVDLPPRAFVGDRFRVPVRVKNSLDVPLGAELRVTRADGLEIDRKDPIAIQVPRRGTALVWLEARAVKPGRARVALVVESGAFQDALERTTRVTPTAVQFRAAYPVSAADGIRLDDVLPPDARNLRGRLRATAGPMAEAMVGLDGMIRRPTGCFEQTAATLYPAILALETLRATGGASPALEKRAREHLLAGYQLLVGYQLSGGGFSLHGKEPARADLTALGIHLMLDLKEIQSVDAKVIQRAARFLAGHLPKENSAASLYMRAALRRAGHDGGRGPVLGQGATVYRVALAAAEGLHAASEAERIRAFLASKVERRGERMVWSPGERTLFAGRDRSWIETTALAVTALARIGGSKALIQGGLETLRATQDIDGAWPTTRETVAALRALLVASREISAEGTVTVGRKLRPQMRIALRGLAGRGEIDLQGLDRRERIAVGFKGKGEPTLTLLVEGGSDQPPSRGPLSLRVRWPSQTVAPGGTLVAEVEIGVRGERGCHAPLVEIPVPGGCRVDLDELFTAADDAGIPRVEVKGGKIHLYFEWLEPGAPRALRIPFIAGMPGRFFTGNPRAWLYYAPDDMVVPYGTHITVEEPGKEGKAAEPK